MTYRVEPSAKARAQLVRFPPAAFDALIEVLSDVGDNPYDPLRTFPTGDEQVRLAVFGGVGPVTFEIYDATQIVLVTDVTWAG